MRFEGEDGEFSGIIGKSETMEIHGTMKFRGGRLIDDVSVTAGWAMKEQLESWMSGNETFDSKGQRVIEFFFNKSGLLRYIKERGTFHPRTLLDRESVGSTKTASAEIQSITGMANPFDYAKPTDLISYFISFCTSNEDIILDFFAGSGSTGHAVIKQSIKDGESRRFFCVQLPEPVSLYSNLGNLGFENIADYSRFRIRKTFESQDLDTSVLADESYGFRAYKLVDTNFTKWKANSGLSEDELVDLFSGLAESADDDARPEALLTEVLLKRRLFSLTEKIETVDVEGLTVFSVADGLVMAYLDEHTQPTLDQLRALVAREPEYLVVLEDAFQGNDELKTNLKQECRTRKVELWTE